MRKSAAVVLALGALVATCRAEPRWCSVAGNDPSNKLVYPPIAKAARVSGVVLAHMIYAPNGKVQQVEPISGPPLLSDSVTRQLANWTVKTDAPGDELCETLVIASFTLIESSRKPPEEPSISLEPSIIRLSVATEPLTLDVVISDPEPLRGWKLFRARLKWELRKIFGSQPST